MIHVGPARCAGRVHCVVVVPWFYVVGFALGRACGIVASGAGLRGRWGLLVMLFRHVMVFVIHVTTSWFDSGIANYTTEH
jgi:hypothetical protein